MDVRNKTQGTDSGTAFSGARIGQKHRAYDWQLLILTGTGISKSRMLKIRADSDKTLFKFEI